MDRSKLKTADFTSGPTSKVSVVKISARSDKVKGGFSWAGLTDFHKKIVLRKMEKKFEKHILHRKVESCFF